MKIWYVQTHASEDEPQRYKRLFPSKALAWAYYRERLADARKSLIDDKDDHIERYGFWDGPDDYPSDRRVIWEAAVDQPDFFEIPSGPTKQQIIQAFDNW